jgi:hypothetical protein
MGIFFKENFMPYVKGNDRARLDAGGAPETAGELNYVITKLIRRYLRRKTMSYNSLNEVLGVLESAKLEFYRRIVAEYEDIKINQNGDVY